jgi:hypothetical protein
VTNLEMIFGEERRREEEERKKKERRKNIYILYIY